VQENDGSVTLAWVMAPSTSARITTSSSVAEQYLSAGVSDAGTTRQLPSSFSEALGTHPSGIFVLASVPRAALRLNYSALVVVAQELVNVRCDISACAANAQRSSTIVTPTRMVIPIDGASFCGNDEVVKFVLHCSKFKVFFCLMIYCVHVLINI
jgi:hypothetical protein